MLDWKECPDDRQLGLFSQWWLQLSSAQELKTWRFPVCFYMCLCNLDASPNQDLPLSNLQMLLIWDLVSVSIDFLVFPSAFRVSSQNFIPISLALDRSWITILGPQSAHVKLAVCRFRNYHCWHAFEHTQRWTWTSGKDPAEWVCGIKQVPCRITRQRPHHVLLFILFP